MQTRRSLSLVVLIALCSFIIVFRLTHVQKKEISWDVLGYYLYLPSSFVHHDPMFTDITWLRKLNEEQNLTGTLYQVSSNAKGEPMYFFLVGMSLFYLPFFMLGWMMALFAGYPVDGFSAPFQWCLVIGGIVYTIIGLIYFRKILLKYFTEAVTAIVLMTIVLGTNYIHHLTLDNLATVNILFMLCAILVWNTIQWHESRKLKNMLAIGLCITLMGLVKPSEIVIGILPLLWSVNSLESLRDKFVSLWQERKSVILTILICMVVALPQLLYWHAKTGNFLYDSYKNPGVGLDILSPHILNTLFSFRKGWLVYTPIMAFSLVGFLFLYKRNPKIFYSILIYFLISFYIICSWSEWWYGAAYSTRPLITMYPLLGISLGCFIAAASEFKPGLRYVIAVVIFLLIVLNQFQWWQFRSYIIDPYRTTRESYKAVFLKTNPDPAFKKDLLVERDFSGGFNFNNREDYNKTNYGNWKFDDDSDEHIRKDSSGNNYYRMFESQEYSKTYQYKYSQFTDKDHVWLEAGVDVRFPVDFQEKFPLLIISVEYQGKVYGYHAIDIKSDTMDGKWHRVTSIYLTPEMRSHKDVVKCYVWKRGKKEFDIDNFSLDVFEHK